MSVLELSTSAEKGSQIHLIRLRGRIDSMTAHDFELFFDELLESGYRFFLLDCDELQWISSAGIAALVQLARRLKGRDGAARLCRVNEELTLTLDFFGLTELMPIARGLQLGREELTELAAKRASFLELGVAEVFAPSAHKIGPGQSARQQSSQKSQSQHSDTAPESEAPAESHYPHLRDIESEGVAALAEPLAEPFIVDCPECSATLRLYQTGRHLCPVCKSELPTISAAPEA